MVKKVLVILGLCLLAGYIIFAAWFFEKKPKEQVCAKFEIEIENKQEGSFVDLSDIEKDIDRKGLLPYGKQLKEINTLKLKEAVEENQLIKSAQVYMTSDNGIRVAVTERVPVLRVINNSGESYYIDGDGQRMPLSKNFTAYLPIATGSVNETFATTELYKFAMYLSSDIFWNAQVEQIVISDKNEVGFIPKVGNHKIILGTLEGYEQKLAKLKLFYAKGLTETGWNRYSTIDLRYDKQVVCTKRPTEIK